MLKYDTHGGLSLICKCKCKCAFDKQTKYIFTIPPIPLLLVIQLSLHLSNSPMSWLTKAFDFIEA